MEDIEQDQSYNINKLLKINTQISKGSEAYIYLGEFLNKQAIIKQRKPKVYRHPLLDEQLRLERLRLESRILFTASLHNIPVPSILAIDPANYLLILEYIEGKTLGEILLLKPEVNQKDTSNLFFHIGKLAGELHSSEIIHGDLTIYNILITTANKLFIIDFGLSFISHEIENLAADLYTFESTLKAFNPHNAQKWFLDFKTGYNESYIQADDVFAQLETILSRGRYVKRNLS
ncbi:MAG: KEOPS complex kinase/ATPase Bud32 [Candidatus Thorarchaeota archaeon]